MIHTSQVKCDRNTPNKEREPINYKKWEAFPKDCLHMFDCQEAEARRSWIQSQTRLLSEFQKSSAMYSEILRSETNVL